MTDRPAGRGLGLFRPYWRTALGLHLLMQLLGFALLTPVTTWVARRLVLASGEPVVSNFDIAGFVLSPAGVAFVLVVAAVTIGLLLAEFTGHTWIAGHALARRPVSVLGSVGFVLGRLPRLLALALRVFLRLAALALPFVAVAALLWFSTLAGHDVNYYLAENPPEWQRARLLGAALGAGYVLLAAWRLARWLFAVPLLAFEGAAPAEALDRSAAMTHGRLAQVLRPLLRWWLTLTAIALALTWLGRQVSDAGLDWAGIDLQRVLPLVAVYLAVSILAGFLYGGLGLAGHQFLVTRSYAEQRDPARVAALAARTDVDTEGRRIARSAMFATLLLFLFALGIGAFLTSRLDLHEDAAVTAHRGASVASPENTLAAFRAALDAGADYIELDVQHTRDRQVVVVHDADLMRMGGDPRKVGALTAAEIATIDIGRKYDAQFARETPPTLAQVIELVRGRAKLNVELKYNVPDPGLAPAVVELLRRADFLDQAVITSLDYAALKQVERLEPRLPTGHIITASVGNVLRTEADFLSLNSAQASASLVRRAHRAGKAVHVWTVNQPEVMLRMVERGVDNLITDDPALARRVLRERQALTTPEILALRLRVLFAKPPRAVTDPSAVAPL